MRSIEEQMAEIQRRKFVYSEQKKIHKLTALASFTGLILFGILLLAPTITGGMGEGTVSLYGATILGPEVGGYVIVAILAFVLGVATTSLIQTKRGINKTAERR